MNEDVSVSESRGWSSRVVTETGGGVQVLDEMKEGDDELDNGLDGRSRHGQHVANGRVVHGEGGTDLTTCSLQCFEVLESERSKTDLLLVIASVLL